MKISRKVESSMLGRKVEFKPWFIGFKKDEKGQFVREADGELVKEEGDHEYMGFKSREKGEVVDVYKYNGRVLYNVLVERGCIIEAVNPRMIKVL